MRRRGRRAVLTGAMAALALMAGAAAAQQAPPADEAPKPPPVWLDEIVVTATRTERTAFDLPSTLDLITAQDIFERRMPRTVPEALREQPGVMVQKTGHGQGSPFIRGFTGFRNLFLIDGVRLNNSVFRDGPNQYWNTVDPLTLERLELIKGPSSVLYGSDAIGGTVNAITRSPEIREGPSWWRRRLYARFASAENYAIWRGEVEGSIDGRLGFLLGTSWKDFGDLHAGRRIGHLPHTGYDELDADVKLQYLLGPASKLTFAHYDVRQDEAWRTHKTIFARLWRGTTIGDELRRELDQDRELTYLQYEAWDLGAFADRMKLNLSCHRQREDRFRIKADAKSELQGFDVLTPGLSLQFETFTPVGTWSYGADYYRDRVDSYCWKYKADGSFDSAEIQGPVADDATYDLLGLFVQNELPVADSLDVILGARYTYARADADDVKDPLTGGEMGVSDRWGTVVGSARGVYHLDEEDHVNLFAGVSQGFRAPNLSDLTRLDTARTNEIETAAPGLDPEKFVSYEAGLKTRYANWSAQGAYFYTDIHDMIVRTPTGRLIGGDNEVTKKNAGDGYVHGVELDTSYRLHPQFTAFGSFAWMEGKVDTYPTSQPFTKREPIDRLMPPTGQLGLRWDHPDRKLWAELICTIAGSQRRLSTRDRADTQRIPPGGTPGYTVFTLRAAWRLRDNLVLSAAIENLTDEDYRIHGSGQNEPGRNFVLALDCTF